MKIKFDNETDFIEIKPNKDKIAIIISCQDYKNANKATICSVELTTEQWLKLISDMPFLDTV